MFQQRNMVLLTGKACFEKATTPQQAELRTPRIERIKRMNTEQRNPVGKWIPIRAANQPNHCRKQSSAV